MGTTIDAYGKLGQWAEQQWGEAALGDARRTRRAMKMGAALAGDLDGRLPAQLLR
ncbi:MAG: transposase [Stenomitos rutilans HA7619-LM2]|nr:transposase [Stenomitos rutilans HA7619-LM2]